MSNIENFCNSIVESKRLDILSESSNDPMYEIIKFCKRLAQFQYICVDKNKNILRNSRENFDKHVTLNAAEFVKYYGGICYDYVNYEATKFPMFGVKFKTFFNGYYKDGVPDSTHTYLLFYLNDKVYWFECSWKSHMGIYEFDSEDNALSYILKLQKGNLDESVVEYKPNSSITGITVKEFINNMATKPEYKFKYNKDIRTKMVYKVEVNYDGKRLNVTDRVYYNR